MCLQKKMLQECFPLQTAYSSTFKDLLSNKIIENKCIEELEKMLSVACEYVRVYVNTIKQLLW